MMTILPEFQQVEGKNAFVKNHPVPPFEKDVWKKTLTPIEQWGHYEAAYTKSLGLIDELNASLVELDSLVHCPEFCTEGITLDLCPYLAISICLFCVYVCKHTYAFCLTYICTLVCLCAWIYSCSCMNFHSHL